VLTSLTQPFADTILLDNVLMARFRSVQELEYPEGHTSRSVYVALPVHTPGAQLA
jgi:hypothetical protein